MCCKKLEQTYHLTCRFSTAKRVNYLMKMFMRAILNYTVLFFFLLVKEANAQIHYFNSEAFWQRLSLQKNNEPITIHKKDTAVIIATNRVFHDTALRFLPDEHNGGIRYFV